MENNTLKGILPKVLARIRLNRMLSAFSLFLYVLTGAYASLFVCSRLLNIIPLKLDLYSVLIPVLGASVCAVVFHSRSSEREAAHTMDSSAGTKDLFLTSLMLEKSSGEFQDLVRERAGEKASAIKPAAVVPLSWRKQAVVSVSAVLILGCAVFFVPQLDPFGRDTIRRKHEEWQKKLEATRSSTLKRLSVLKKENIGDRNTKPVALALKDLKMNLKKMEKGNRTGNLKKLGKNQKELGELWRKANAENMQKSAQDGTSRQKFGRLDPHKSAQWRKNMSKGDSSGMKKETAKMRRTLSRLRKTTDPAERERLKQQLKEQMKDMEEFFSQNMNAEGVRSAIKQAMEQLDMSDLKGLDQDALQALKDSMDLTDAELDRFAQSLRDMQDLEQALLTLQKAKQLNQGGKLGGEKGEGEGDQGGMSLEEYEKMYNEMLAEGKEGSGAGEGMKGPGTGKGGDAPEDDEKKTAFTPEQSKSALTAGKILLQMKSRGMGEKGSKSADYQERIQEVRQGVSEAILQEEVPPDYHDSIKGYFDTLEDAADDGTSE